MSIYLRAHPSIFGVVELDAGDPVRLWVEKTRGIILPEKWDLINEGNINIAHQYALVESIGPENILKENKQS